MESGFWNHKTTLLQWHTSSKATLPKPPLSSISNWAKYSNVWNLLVISHSNHHIILFVFGLLFRDECAHAFVSVEVRGQLVGGSQFSLYHVYLRIKLSPFDGGWMPFIIEPSHCFSFVFEMVSHNAAWPWTLTFLASPPSGITSVYHTCMQCTFLLGFWKPCKLPFF